MKYFSNKSASKCEDHTKHGQLVGAQQPWGVEEHCPRPELQPQHLLLGAHTCFLMLLAPLTYRGHEEVLQLSVSFCRAFWVTPTSVYFFSCSVLPQLPDVTILDTKLPSF